MNDNIRSAKRWLFFIVSLLIMAFGVSFSIKANLGTSPISSLPYVTDKTDQWSDRWNNNDHYALCVDPSAVPYFAEKV